MRIAIIGAGNMGAAFARRLGAAGHEVSITSRDVETARKVAEASAGKVRAAPAAEVAAGAEVVIAATPAGEQTRALRSAGDLTGKIVVDITNPLKPDLSGLTVGLTTSFAEELGKALPGAKVVKAFNTVFAHLLAEGSDLGGGRRAAVFFAGDDAEAKGKVRALIESIGFEPIDAGPLANARLLEPMGMLNIWFGFVAKWGTRIAPTWLRR